ncbi:uncharacterized protein LOC125224923 [Leguminivora glycinivorella]|uniref:uncharacterized protein LOC125224923 n=1 Tax=Leguminivora glycinivorella TaxID=1035111 RepID=UPI002010B00D|nr:uncharacterized protein LOC125224923 [Leguminivora glycinivorella]
MYTGYLFITAFSILAMTAVCDDSISTSLEGNKMSMPVDDLCTTAGFVKNPNVPTKQTATGGTKQASTGDKDAPAMSITAIILTVLGVMVFILGAGLFALYLHNKQKVN